MNVAELVGGHELDVLVRPASASIFASILREYLDRSVRVEGIAWPSHVWEDLEALEAAGAAYRDSRRRRPTVVAPVVATTATATTPGRLVTVSEAAAIEGVDRRVIARRCDRGSLPFEKDERGRRMIRIENLRRPSDG
jgi:hypothetical protein